MSGLSGSYMYVSKYAIFNPAGELISERTEQLRIPLSIDPTGHLSDSEKLLTQRGYTIVESFTVGFVAQKVDRGFVSNVSINCQGL